MPTLTPAKTQYAKCGDVHIAYQEFGSGSVNVVLVPGFISHIENYWDDPSFARWLERLGSFARVVLFDKRGTGLSDRTNELPDLDQRMDDVRTVMDAVGLERAVLFGISEGGTLATLFAASHPERAHSLILYGAFAKFKSWYATEKELQGLFDYIDTSWGSGESIPQFAPSKQDDPAFKQWWGKFERLGASPGAVKALMHMNKQIDITEILPSVNVPSLIIHRRNDVTVDVEAGRLFAERIPDAKYVELSGADHIPWVGDNADQILDEIARFITGEWRPVEVDRVLSTVMFTDIVNSTGQAAEIGDQDWRDMLQRHDTVLQRQVGRFRGRVVKNTGDGVLATFDAPARAIRCAAAIRDEVGRLGISTRVGLHTGEIELIEADVGGIAVHIAARVMGQARTDEVWASRTVRDLVVGSGFRFNAQGTHELKGIPGDWELFSIEV